MSIADNIENVMYKIECAAKRSGRKKEDINLIAVSKTVDVPYMLEAVKCGISDFGENRPQQIRDKSEFIKDVNWHQIGQLQSNKIKYVAGKTKLIHSVDSEKLLFEIDEYCKTHGLSQNVLIQLNISKEQTKSGIYLSELEKILESAEKLKCTKIKGFMTIGSFYADISENKKYFEICNKIFVDISSKKYDNIDMQYLSMGMSGDFESAIEMGSNTVRIGTSIFGERNYNI